MVASCVTASCVAAFPKVQLSGILPCTTALLQSYRPQPATNYFLLLMGFELSPWFMSVLQASCFIRLATKSCKL